MQKPLLEGIRVLDLGRFIAAPYAGQLLADLGADVVRVERPRPEPDRERGPYLDGQSIYFVTLNRGKRSVAFDMFSEAGRQLLHEALPVWKKTQERFVGALGPEAWAALNSGLRQVVPTVQALESGGLPAASSPTPLRAGRR